MLHTFHGGPFHNASTAKHSPDTIIHITTIFEYDHSRPNKRCQMVRGYYKFVTDRFVWHGSEPTSAKQLDAHITKLESQH